MTEATALRTASSRRGLWRPEGPPPAKGHSYSFFVLFFKSGSRSLTLQRSLEGQAQQARNDDVMEASSRLLRVLGPCSYFLEAVTGQHHLIQGEPAAPWSQGIFLRSVSQ